MQAPTTSDTHNEETEYTNALRDAIGSSARTEVMDRWLLDFTNCLASKLDLNTTDIKRFMKINISSTAATRSEMAWFYCYRLGLDAEQRLKLTDFSELLRKARELAPTAESEVPADGVLINIGANDAILETENMRKLLKLAHAACRTRGRKPIVPTIEMYMRSAWLFFCAPHTFVYSAAKAVRAVLYRLLLGFPFRQCKIAPDAFYYRNGNVSLGTYGDLCLPSAIAYTNRHLRIQNDFVLRKPVRDDRNISSQLNEDLYSITSCFQYVFQSIRSLILLCVFIPFPGYWQSMNETDIIPLFTIFVMFSIFLKSSLVPTFKTNLSIYITNEDEEDMIEKKTFKIRFAEFLERNGESLVYFILYAFLGYPIVIILIHHPSNTILWKLNLIFSLLIAVDGLRSSSDTNHPPSSIFGLCLFVVFVCLMIVSCKEVQVNDSIRLLSIL
ncbi:hypothetical protein G6F37_000938 [Rhizopus arrhizus]|nr:hypothetical protein G6F38_000094 [Rhizopus arrhizus]KAG1163742.1 hypothetical protein G6F37_000938 [Rhizopus arrhizus]